MDISVEKEWDEIFPSESSPNSLAPNSPDSMLIVTSSLSVFTGTCFSMSFSTRGKTVCRLCHLLIHSPLIRTLYPGCEEPVCSAYSPSALPNGFKVSVQNAGNPFGLSSLRPTRILSPEISISPFRENPARSRLLTGTGRGHPT